MTNLDTPIGKDSQGNEVTVRDLLRKHQIETFLAILNVDQAYRDRFFTPVKYAWDFWLYSESGLYELDPETWQLRRKESQPIPELSFDKNYYADLEHLLTSLRGTRIDNLKSLTIKGDILLQDAILRGTVIIENKTSGQVDIVALTGQKEFEDVRIVVKDEGDYTIEKLSENKDLASTLSGKPLTPQQENILRELLNKYLDQIQASEPLSLYRREELLNTLGEEGYHDIAQVLENSIIVRGPPQLFEEFKERTGVVLLGTHYQEFIIINPYLTISVLEVLVHEGAAKAGYSHQQATEVASKIIQKQFQKLALDPFFLLHWGLQYLKFLKIFDRL